MTVGTLQISTTRLRIARTSEKSSNTFCSTARPLHKLDYVPLSTSLRLPNVVAKRLRSCLAPYERLPAWKRRWERLWKVSTARRLARRPLGWSLRPGPQSFQGITRRSWRLASHAKSSPFNWRRSRAKVRNWSRKSVLSCKPPSKLILRRPRVSVKPLTGCETRKGYYKICDWIIRLLGRRSRCWLRLGIRVGIRRVLMCECHRLRCSATNLLLISLGWASGWLSQGYECVSVF